MSDDLVHEGNLSREQALALVDCELGPLLRAAAPARG